MLVNIQLLIQRNYNTYNVCKNTIFGNGLLKANNRYIITLVNCWKL